MSFDDGHNDRDDTNREDISGIGQFSKDASEATVTNRTWWSSLRRWGNSSCTVHQITCMRAISRELGNLGRATFEVTQVEEVVAYHLLVL